MKLYSINPTGDIQPKTIKMQEYKTKRGAIISGHELEKSEKSIKVQIETISGNVLKSDWKKGDIIFIPIDQIIEDEPAPIAA